MRFKKNYIRNAVLIGIFVTFLWRAYGTGYQAVVQYSSGLLQGASSSVTYAGDARISNNIRRGPNALQCYNANCMVKNTADFTTNQLLDVIDFGGTSKHYEGFIGDNFTRFKHSTDTGYIATPLEVVVIPHSHNDPGWLKTYMGYFNDDTTHILTNMVKKLTEHKDMTFVWVESCFLDVWWKNQTGEVRDAFKSLVKSGRLEIVSGMWVAPDEASTHYFALIDQMIEGHYWVKTNLGIVPESSLNFDQFGYSVSVPYLVKKAGIKQVLIKRVHRKPKMAMAKYHWMEFNWRQFWDQEGHDDILGHIEPYEWMAIVDSCGPTQSICDELNFRNHPDFPAPGSDAVNKPIGNKYKNFHNLVETFLGQMKIKASYYEQRALLLPNGGDFMYATPGEWDKQYRNLKIFIDYVNAHVKDFNVHMRFGTLKDYFKILEEHKKYKLKFPTVSGDFYTYAEGTDFWTGYFTTRMFDKRLGREVQESLRAAELFTAILLQKHHGVAEEIKQDLIKRLVDARQDLGLFMHHDAITGTSRAHVVIDYEKRISSAFTSTQHVLATSVTHLVSTDNKDAILKFQPTLIRDLHNMTTRPECIEVTGSGLQISLLNPLTQSRTELVSICVLSDAISILDSDNNQVDFDRRTARQGNIIEFEAFFPPVSLLIYTIKKLDNKNKNQHEVKSVLRKDGQYVCENKYVSVTFDLTTGNPRTLCSKDSNICEDIEVLWTYYNSMSGAYTLSSRGSKATAISGNTSVSVGDGTKSCKIKLYSEVVEVEYSLSKTDDVSSKGLKINLKTKLSAHYNGDLAMEFQTKIKNSDYYTDSNGLQMLQRKHRKKILFGGNVYPITSMTFIQDSIKRLILHTAQPHGVVSTNTGLLTVFVDRTAARPEGGLPEGVRDVKPTKTEFVLQLEAVSDYDTPNTHETLLPSVTSLFMNDVLQHPIYTLKAAAPTPVHIHQTRHTFLRQRLPLDIIIANVKNLADINYETNGTSVTLHRRGAVCNTRKATEVCPAADGVRIKPGELLGTGASSKPQITTEMYLSHLKVKSSAESGDGVFIEPFDLKTFHLTSN